MSWYDAEESCELLDSKLAVPDSVHMRFNLRSAQVHTGRSKLVQELLAANCGFELDISFNLGNLS